MCNGVCTCAYLSSPSRQLQMSVLARPPLSCLTPCTTGFSFSAKDLRVTRERERERERERDLRVREKREREKQHQQHAEDHSHDIINQSTATVSENTEGKTKKTLA